MRLKKVLCLSLSLAMVLGGINVSTVEAKNKVSISNKKLTIKVGNTKKINLKGAKKKVKWSVKGKKIVSIKATGKKKQVCKIKAKRAGKCVIKAKYKGASYKCKVTVTQDNKGVSVTPVTNVVPNVIPSKNPVVTSKPSVKPVITPDTKPIETPKVNTESSEKPVVSSKPTGTPTVSAEPSSSPVISEEPSSTPRGTIEPTGTPVVTMKPTSTPKPVPTPVMTAKPSNTPKVTVKPTGTPVATVKPTVKPSIKPTATPHVHTDVVVGTEDTCMKCSTCGEVTKNHYFNVDTIREPNCGSQFYGLDKYTCKYCNYSYKKSTKWEHNYKNYVCTSCGMVNEESENYVGHDYIGTTSHPSTVQLYWFKVKLADNTEGYDVVIKTLGENVYTDKGSVNGYFMANGGIKNADIHNVIFANKVNIRNCDSLFSNLGENLHNKSSSIVSSIINLENLDTTGATSMRSMFDGACLDGDLVCDFNTENVETMKNMFRDLLDVRSVTLKLNNTDKLTSTSGMFEDSRRLQYIENKGVFNTKNVTDMSYMFSFMGAKAYSYGKTTSYTDKGIDNTIGFMESLNTSKVIYFQNMFRGAFKDLDNKEITLDLSGYDTSSAESMDSMFGNFNYCNNAKCVLKIRIASTKVSSMFRYMFADFAVTSFKNNKDSVIDLGSSFFDISGGIDKDACMFAGSNILRLTADNETSKENIRKIIQSNNITKYVTVS